MQKMDSCVDNASFGIDILADFLCKSNCNVCSAENMALGVCKDCGLLLCTSHAVLHKQLDHHHQIIDIINFQPYQIEESSELEDSDKGISLTIMFMF